MAEFEPGRSRVWLIVVALAGAFGLGIAVPPATGQGVLTGSIDIPSYSARAAAWSEANTFHRAAAVERATQAARERERVERVRQAALASEPAPTPTTLPPTTTAVPTTTAPTTTIEPPSTTSTVAPPNEPDDSSPGPTAAQWEALRQCESGGRYDAISPNGLYRGAYQFSQSTWDWVASFANPSLVGVDPASAAPADQDAQALALYDRRVASPWPTCGAHLQ